MFPADIGRSPIATYAQMPPPSDMGSLAPSAAPTAVPASASSVNDAAGPLIVARNDDGGAADRAAADAAGAKERAAADAAGAKERAAADAAGAKERAAADAQGAKDRAASDKRLGLSRDASNANSAPATSHGSSVVPIVEGAAIAVGAAAVIVALAPVEIPAGIATGVLGGLAAIF